MRLDTDCNDSIHCNPGTRECEEDEDRMASLMMRTQVSVASMSKEIGDQMKMVTAVQPSLYACLQPQGYLSDGTDCDDERADVSPRQWRSVMVWTTRRIC